MSDAKGRALAVGVNRLKPSRRYDGLPELGPCENDAEDMADIAKSKGFSAKTLLTNKATHSVVIAEITAAAEALEPGDIFMLSFSGHGQQAYDESGDEAQSDGQGESDGLVEVDQRDETWCLYDKELIDDELYRLWLKFKPGVRIIVFSDSCHSGTILGGPGATRRRVRRKPVKATVLLISACLDRQNAGAGQAGASNSIFTARLRQVWNGGRFRGGYRSFWKEIENGLPRAQTSNFLRVGATNTKFLKQTPFTI